MRQYITDPKELDRLDGDQIMSTGKDLHGCEIPTYVIPETNIAEAQKRIDANKKRHAKLNRYADICSMHDPEEIEEAKEIAERDYCAECHPGCMDQDTCDGFRKEVGDILREWENE